MGCACGKGGGKTIAQASRSGPRTAALQPGSVESDPLVMGEPDDVVRRVRVAQTTSGLRVGNAYWLTGTGVDALLASGKAVEITGVQQKSRQYKVGAFTYSDPAQAKRVAAALGTKPIEVA